MRSPSPKELVCNQALGNGSEVMLSLTLKFCKKQSSAPKSVEEVVLSYGKEHGDSWIGNVHMSDAMRISCTII